MRYTHESTAKQPKGSLFFRILSEKMLFLSSRIVNSFKVVVTKLNEHMMQTVAT